jgi:hypothetical protein
MEPVIHSKIATTFKESLGADWVSCKDNCFTEFWAKEFTEILSKIKYVMYFIKNQSKKWSSHNTHYQVSRKPY